MVLRFSLNTPKYAYWGLVTREIGRLVYTKTHHRKLVDTSGLFSSRYGGGRRVACKGTLFNEARRHPYAHSANGKHASL
jgi:hypothetical protein